MKFLLLALTALSLSQAPAQAASALRCNLVATNNSSITVKLTVAGGITSFFNSKKKLAPGASTSYSYSTAGISQYGPIPVTVTDSRLLQGRILGGFIG